MTKYTITQTELEKSEKVSLQAELEKSKKVSLQAKQSIKNLPYRLWKLRTDIGISQIALGKELGISNKQISNFELGNNYPSPKALYSYSKFFGISMHEIVFGKNSDYPADTVSSTKERTCRFLLNAAAIIHNCFEAKEDPS